MFLTVTLNSAVDRVLLIDELRLGGATEASKEVLCVGGKGLDVSVALSGLGQPSVGLSFMAGKNGRFLEEILHAYGITTETIWVEGETRLNTVISETKQKRVSHIKVGELLIRPEHVQLLHERFSAHLKGARFVILAGSVPASMDPAEYSDLTRLAHASQVPVLVDSHGGVVMKILPQKPEILKQNWDEFNNTFGFSTKTLDELQLAARQVQAEYTLSTLVITCGAEGMLAFKRGESYRVTVPNQAVLNAAGAGDAASAALAWRISEGDSWTDALRWCGAVSAAAVLTEATGEVRLIDAERIYPLVEVVLKKEATAS